MQCSAMQSKKKMQNWRDFNRYTELDIIPIKVTNQSTKMRKMYSWHGYLLFVHVKIIKSNAKSKHLSHFLCMYMETVWMHDFFLIYLTVSLFLFLDFVSFIATVAVSSSLFYIYDKKQNVAKAVFTETNWIWYLVSCIVV